jgi:hypothetical protein
VPLRKVDDEIAMQEGGAIRRQYQAAIRHLREGRDGALDVGGVLYPAWHDHRK